MGCDRCDTFQEGEEAIALADWGGKYGLRGGLYWLKCIEMDWNGLKRG